MPHDQRPLLPDGADSCRALAFAMLWALVLVVIATAALAFGWSPLP